MERYFEHLINLVYREFYPKVANFYGKALPFASSYIKFGGFEISLHGYGRTSLAYEEIGDVKIITKTIYFHTGFLLHLTGWENHDFAFHLHHFVDTIAHELAHCFRADFDPTKVREHDDDHKLLKKKFAEYLWTLPEIEALTNLQKNKKFLK